MIRDGLDSLFVAYWSLRDPLCGSQVLPVVRHLALEGYRMGVMTFEHPAWRLTSSDASDAVAELREQGVRWLPKRYHARPKVVSTVFDALNGALGARRARARLLHGRGTVPAAIAYLASRATRSFFFNDADGPLSQEYVDAGIWRAGSSIARFVGRAERRFFETADACAALTTVQAAQVGAYSRVAPVVLPCAVDTQLFAPRREQRLRLHAELSLEGTVFVYAGKWGGWYLVEPMIDFVAAYQRIGETTTLLVLTTTPPEPFEQAAAARGVRCRVRRVSREDMPDYLSAADVGLSFILRAPSKRACSPVKNGEYLACGLPVVTTDGVGDYSRLVESERAGVVVDGLAPDELERSARCLRDRLQEGDALRRRCRDVARSHAGLDEVVMPRYRALYRELLGAPGGGE